MKQELYTEEVLRTSVGNPALSEARSRPKVEPSGLGGRH